MLHSETRHWSIPKTPWDERVCYLCDTKKVLTGEIDRPSTERVEPVQGCLITQALWNEPP